MNIIIPLIKIITCIFLLNSVILISANEEILNSERSDLLENPENISNLENATEIEVSIDIIRLEQEKIQREKEKEQEKEERRQVEEGEALNVCDEPSSTDQFLYLFVFTNVCYAYSGSGPRWSEMTGWAFDENDVLWVSVSTKRILDSGSLKSKNSGQDSSTSTTVYSCGNGKKLPPFAPIVHILNASWFLHASTTSKSGEDKEKENKTKEQDGGEKKDGDESGQNGTSGLNDTTAATTNGTAISAKEPVQNKSNPDEDWCMMVNFYSPSCPFSARLAPFYNALPRVFPKLLYIAAVDATESSRLNLIYGVAGTPTVMLFHNGKPVARVDDGEGNALQKLVMFTTKHTDLKPLSNVDVEDEDLDGPLPSVPIRGIDYYLILAWIFIIACAIYYGARSSTAQRLWETLCRNWREMEEMEEEVVGE